MSSDFGLAIRRAEKNPAVLAVLVTAVEQSLSNLVLNLARDYGGER